MRYTIVILHQPGFTLRSMSGFVREGEMHHRHVFSERLVAMLFPWKLPENVYIKTLHLTQGNALALLFQSCGHGQLGGRNLFYVFWVSGPGCVGASSHFKLSPLSCLYAPRTPTGTSIRTQHGNISKRRSLGYVGDNLFFV